MPPSVGAAWRLQGVSGRRQGGAVYREAAPAGAGRPRAKGRPGRAAAAEAELRAEPAAAEAAESEIETGEGQPALCGAGEAAEGRRHERADLALDVVEQRRRVEHVGDQVEAKPVEEPVQAGEVLDADRITDRVIVALDAGGDSIGGGLGNQRAGRVAGGGVGERQPGNAE